MKHLEVWELKAFEYQMLGLDILDQSQLSEIFRHIDSCEECRNVAMGKSERVLEDVQIESEEMVAMPLKYFQELQGVIAEVVKIFL